MRRSLPVAVAILLLVGATVPAAARAGSGGASQFLAEHQSLQVSITKAPVAPDGTTAGAVTDLVVTFRDADPTVPGVGIKAGGTVTVTLPPEFVDTGTVPFQRFATPGCSPPLVQACNTALLLQGWPQSPVPPFPTVAWEPASRALTVTATADWFPAGPGAPGPKQLHLLLLGFRNPDRPGHYPIRLEIRPDPSADSTLVGTGSVRIQPRPSPSIEVTSVVNGAPPPPFPNTVYQTVKQGDPLLRYGFYLWGREGEPYGQVQLRMATRRFGAFTDADGRLVGLVWVRAPRGARAFELVADGPAVTRPAFITGIPTAQLTAAFVPDPDITGSYTLTLSLFGGNRQTMHVDVLPDPAR
ncbi:MAG TPA: hypothetical protein VFZ85_03335 [Jiangellaceae bacterium]